MTSPRDSILDISRCARLSVRVAIGLACALLTVGCTFDDTPLEQRECSADSDCEAGLSCLDGYCRQTVADVVLDTTDPDDDTDLVDTTPVDTAPIDTWVAPRDPVLSTFEAEVTPAVVAPDRRWTTTFTLRLERGIRDTGTDLLLITEPTPLELDLDTLQATHDGQPLEIAEAVRDGDELQLVFAQPLPDGIVTLTAEVDANTDGIASWTLRALATTPEEHDVDATAADTDANPGNSDGLDQDVRRLFTTGHGELVAAGQGFGPRVFVAPSTLETHGLHDAGASRGTLYLRLDQPHPRGVDHLTITLEQPADLVALDLVEVRVEGQARPIVDADPTGDEVAIGDDGAGTLTLEAATAWTDADDDGQLAVEIDLEVQSDGPARGDLILSTWLGEAPDIVEPLPAGDATSMGARDSLDIEVWTWTSRYTRDFSQDPEHIFATDGTFDGWAARAGGNGGARITNGALMVRNYLFEAAGTTLVYRAVPDYAGGALRIGAELTVQPYHDVSDNSPSGTSFYFGAFANETTINTVALNGHHTTAPLGYGAWVYSGFETDQLVSGHWGIVDTTAPNHMSGALAGSELGKPSSWLDWDPTGLNARSLIAVYGAHGELDVWLFEPDTTPEASPQMQHHPQLSPAHDQDGMIFFAMTDEGDLAITQVRVDELIPPPPAP